ncbi:MAG: Ku protein [Candidatus Eisenbacteria bacterium]
MAPRSIATATVSFGLVSIPVKLFSTAQSSEGISFRMLHAKCRTPIRQQYVCPADNEKVDRDQIVKGYEFAKDQFVLFSQEEIEALEEEATKAIAIEEFVPLDTIDPVYFDRAYYLGPDKGGDRAYKLLARAMADTGLGGLARYAARGKEYIVLVRPLDGGLVMQQLRHAEEVRPISEVPVGNGGEVKDAELALALQLLRQSASDEFHPERYEDQSRKRFQEILQKKIEGQQFTIASSEAPPPKVIDLMEALKASLAEAPAAGGGKGSASRTGGAASPRRGASPRRDAEREAEGAAAASRGRAGAATRRPPRSAALPDEKKTGTGAAGRGSSNGKGKARRSGAGGGA